MAAVTTDPTSTDLALRSEGLDTGEGDLAPPGDLSSGANEPVLTPATVVPDRTRTFGTLLFVIADAMVLAGLVAAYFAVKQGSGSWPPGGVKVGTYIPTTVTITVLMSAFSAQWAVFAIRGNDQRNAVAALILTMFFGLASVNAEIQELNRAGFGLASHAYGTFFYVFTGYFLIHVIAGIVILILLAGRALAGHFSNEHHDPLRAGVVFWHYTNTVWFVIVTVLFLLSRHG